MAALRTEYRTADLLPAERTMLEVAAQVTRDATRIGPADVEPLRAAGFDDRAIVRITALASWFNDINRMADAVGLGRT